MFLRRPGAWLLLKRIELIRSLDLYIFTPAARNGDSCVVVFTRNNPNVVDRGVSICACHGGAMWRIYGTTRQEPLLFR